MVVNNVVETLTAIGFSEYEARAYVSALTLQSATAYEISRDSGIPSSKIYETIARLKEKNLLFEKKEQTRKKYVPLAGDEFLAEAKILFGKRFASLESGFQSLKLKEDVSFIYNLHEYDFLLEKSRRLISEAKESILLSVWHNELEHIIEDLKKAETRGVKIAVIHFGRPVLNVGTLFTHPIEDTLYAEKGGRGFTIVADALAAIMGTVFEDNRVEGAWSANRGFVMLAEDYIKHDIYIMKIVTRFDQELITRFGKNYALLRDIYTDKEVKK
jgi:sugar-specific transcriptional regulator TrmB